jgi:chorismate mutase/prephenate dehydratase
MSIGSEHEREPALDEARQEIDRVDRELVRLLQERMTAVKQVGEAKARESAGILVDPAREQDVLRAWSERAEELGLSGYFASRVLREILNYSRRSQEVPPHDASQAVARVGYQGEPGCYSDLAVTKLFATRGGGGCRSQGYSSFLELVDAVENEELDYALLPIENSCSGSIGEVDGLLLSREVSVVDEEVWPVEHCLAGLQGATAEALEEIRSHPVALQQCRRLFSSLKRARVKEFYDTAGAARSVREGGDTRIAAICSEAAAERYGLSVLRRGVADQPSNQTRFVLISRKPEAIDARVSAKTTISFAARHSCGTLADSLKVLADRGVNLTRLESRPRPEAPWKYLFIADIEGNAGEDRIAEALDELRSRSSHLRVLGTYPCRTAEMAPMAVPVRERAAPKEENAVPSVPAEAAPTNRSDRGGPLHALRSPEHRTTVDVSGVEIGPGNFTMILGPCAVESAEQIQDAAEMVKARGARLLRGGAFKPRSSPYSFQGLGYDGLKLLVDAGARYELPVVTEVVQPEDVEAVAEQADMLQVGARSMQNFALLKELGKVRTPVLLKRGMSATIKELLQAAEYVMAGGNLGVVLCERGIRTFETSMRNTLDLGAIPVLRGLTHLPVLVDPSHAAGVRHLVTPLALAAAAAGADGLIVECHPRPEEALCDKDQALTAQDVDGLVARLRPIVDAEGRTL